MDWPPVKGLASSASSELGLLPPPQAGEGWGGGELAHMNLVAYPLPLPPPQAGGIHRARRFIMLQHKRTCSISSLPLSIGDRPLRAGTGRTSACRISRRGIAAGRYCRSPPCRRL